MSITKNQDIVELLARDPAYLDNLLYVESTKTFYLYNGKYHKPMSDDDFKKTIYQHTKSEHPDINIKVQLVNDIFQQLKWQCYERIEDVNTPYVALNDMVLNTETFEFEPHSKERIAINHMNFNSTDVPDAECPKFMKFLDEILVDNDLQPDLQLHTLMQEIFGYYLTNKIENHEMFFFVGEGSNGKSVLLSLLMDMIGAENCTAKTIESLTTNQWALAGLAGKKVNICHEEESKFLRSDKFKALVSGDPVEAQRKFKDSLLFVPRVKYIFATNLIPTFEGLNKGLKRRINIVPFLRSFSKKEMNRNLINELSEELPGILKWALEGGKRIKANDWEFSETKALYKTMNDFVEGVSSALSFFSDELKTTTMEYEPKKETYDRYKGWCIDTGHRPMGRKKFIADIREQHPDIDEKVIKTRGVANRSWTVTQKDLNDEVELEIDETETVDLDNFINSMKF